MVKTKTTPKTDYRRCPMCSENTKSEEDFKQHIMVCAMRTFQCSTCNYTNARELNVKRHIKRSHPGLQPNDELIKLGPKDQSKKKANDSLQNEKTSDENTGKEDWLNQDPGELIGEVSSGDSSCGDGSSDENEEDVFVKKKKDQNLKGREENLLEGRIIRKKTQPSEPFTKKRTSQEEIPVLEKLSKIDRATQVEIQPSTPPAHGKLVHASTQTSPKKRIVVTTTVRTHREGEADVKVISKEKIVYK